MSQQGNGMFVMVGVYDDQYDADIDYDSVKDLHASGVIGTYDAAVVTKDARGKVHVRKHEKPTQHGAWSGLAIGALLGAVFPPGMLAGGIIGATAGGLIGHFRRGVSRRDLDDLGQELDRGEWALIVVGESKVAQAVARELKRTSRMIQKELDADAAELRAELDSAIDDAERQRA
jgi:uncharacterized membrane protein